MDLLLLLGVTVAGGLAGFLLRRSLRAVAWMRRATTWALGALLGVMGARLATHRALFAQDWHLMLAAIASSAILAGLFFLGAMLIPLGRRTEREPEEGQGPGGGHELRVVAVNCAWILGGFLVMILLPARASAALPVGLLGDVLLQALLACVGFDLGAELHRLELRRLRPILLLVPVVNLLLSLAAGILFGLLARRSLREGMLLVSGMGWYSLSSVLIAERGLPLLSILAFIHNVFRELFAILLAPVAARLNPYLPVYLGGATAMDVMLPFVQRYSGRRFTLVSFYSGVVCSLAVIPLVRLLAGR